MGISTKIHTLIEKNQSSFKNRNEENLIIRFFEKKDCHLLPLSFDEYSPFVCSGRIISYGKDNERLIGYDDALIRELQLNEEEIIALVLHEIGHFLYKGEITDGLKKEKFCDDFSR